MQAGITQLGRDVEDAAIATDDTLTAAGSMPNMVALVPMRHKSERVPEKNYRPLAGKPLYTYILETLRKCPEIDQIVVDTDSPIIRQGIEDAFPEIALINRPEELRGGDVPMNDVLVHDVSQVNSTYYLQTHSTNPLLRADTISSAITAFIAAYPEHDSMFSVTPVHARLWNSQGQPINHDPKVLLNTQDLPPVFLENSCLYLFERGGFMKRGNRIGERPLLFEVGAQEATDIDDEQAFALADRLMVETEGRNP